MPFTDPASGDEDPYDYFRLKLVCVLLESVGHLFTKGARQTKMDRFLLYFQRYILCKKELPLRVEYFIADAFEKLKPSGDYERLHTLTEVDARILEMLEHDVQYFGSEWDRDEEAEDVTAAVPGGAGSGAHLISYAVSAHRVFSK